MNASPFQSDSPNCPGHPSGRLPTGVVGLRRWAVVAGLLVVSTGFIPSPVEEPGRASDLTQQVEIRRTEFGVPHILADNVKAGMFALAWVQLEDHGADIIRGMHAARGRMALVEGEGLIDADARARQRHVRAMEAFPLLNVDTRDAYSGFAEGMNQFIRVHQETLPEWIEADFTGVDVLARDISWAAEGTMEAFRRRLASDLGDPALLMEHATDGWVRAPAGDRTYAGDGLTPDGPRQQIDGLDAWSDAAHNVGSNAWALAPERTQSGHAILMRNPHLAWSAGYYEAHLRVPGKIDFYGDFRIGGPFTVIGGFNPRLGFSTTNNESRSHEIYAFRLHPERADHIVLDGAPVALATEIVTVEYLSEDGSPAEASRTFWTSPFGPVFHRSDDLVYVLRSATHGDYRAGEQWLEMMKAESLEEWTEAMRIQARATSNFTYADADGNILLVWVAAAPILPHPAGGDTLAVLATRRDQVWSRIASFDDLPQVLNPPGGYVRNENDSPHFSNMNAILPHDFEFWVQPPRLRLRSQHGVELLHNDRIFALEDAVETKHSSRMLLADRVKEDLLAAVASTSPQGEVAEALALLRVWDNTVAHDSRGGVLFEAWWNRYRDLVPGRDLHAVEWNELEPMTTPRGLAEPALAVEAFEAAVPATAARHGSWDVAWGEVHRVRRGDVDEPVSGCGGALGCFRVLNFENAEDGRRVVNGGDGWVIAVEFGPTPRAYSVLAYGQSPDPASPWHANQAALFARGEMKPVRWTEKDIEAFTTMRYRPGR